MTSIDWSSPATIGIGIAIIAVVAIGGYLWWAYSEKSGRFSNKSIMRVFNYNVKFSMLNTFINY